MTTLKEYIDETVQQIASAIGEFNQRQEAKGDARVRILGPALHSGTGQDSVCIDYDVAVTVEASSERSGKAGAKVYVVDVGGEVASGKTETSANRVKFTLALAIR